MGMAATILVFKRFAVGYHVNFKRLAMACHTRSLKLPLALVMIVMLPGPNRHAGQDWNAVLPFAAHLCCMLGSKLDPLLPPRLLL